MKHIIFSVYDSKAEAYLPPFYFNTLGLAIRAFSEIVNDREHAFYRYSEDYTLFRLGDWEDATASFTMLPTPEAIGKAIEFKTQKELFDTPLLREVET